MWPNIQGPFYAANIGLIKFGTSVLTLLGGMPIKFIGNSFVTFYTKHLPLEFISNYDVYEIPLKSIGKSFNIQSNYYLRRIFPKRITGESF